MYTTLRVRGRLEAVQGRKRHEPVSTGVYAGAGAGAHHRASIAGWRQVALTALGLARTSYATSTLSLGNTVLRSAMRCRR